MSVIVGRSRIATKYGIVAASQPLAAQAGVQILERGGNAIDAAIATNAVMGLVEPQSNGIGGDLFAIVYEAKTGALHGLNACGWAPAGLTPALLKAQGHAQMPQAGIHTVTVPGAVAGWEALRARLGIAAVRRPAGARDPVRRRRLPGLRRHRRALGGAGRQAGGRTEALRRPTCPTAARLAAASSSATPTSRHRCAASPRTALQASTRDPQPTPS